MKQEEQVGSFPSGLAQERFRENAGGKRKPTLLRVQNLLHGKTTPAFIGSSNEEVKDSNEK